MGPQCKLSSSFYLLHFPIFRQTHIFYKITSLFRQYIYYYPTMYAFQMDYLL